MYLEEKERKKWDAGAMSSAVKAILNKKNGGFEGYQSSQKNGGFEGYQSSQCSNDYVEETRTTN